MNDPAILLGTSSFTAASWESSFYPTENAVDRLLRVYTIGANAIMPRPAIQRLNSPPRKTAAFVEPMECALVAQLRDSPKWLYEIKLDG